MNQFRKAKQQAQEAGKKTESIADLKTAGVTHTDLKENTSTQKSTVNQEITDVKTTINNEGHAISDENNQPSELEKKNTQETNNSIIAVEAPKENTTVISEINTSQSELTESAMLTNNAATEYSINETLPDITPDDTEIATLASPSESIINAAPPIELPQIAEQPSSMIPPTEVIVAAKPELNTPTYTETQQTNVLNIPIVSTQPLPHSELRDNTMPQTMLQKQPQAQERSFSSKAANSAKKNIPNIFAPKGEAKSMRKSLVLKPTSVKIAENYCAKNGGSFNELIQTLLDNFIDEYGL